MKIWLTPSLLDLVLQHCPIWPLRAPVLAKPHETLHEGIVWPALVKMGVSSFTAASSQDSRVMGCGGWVGFIGFQVSDVDIFLFSPVYEYAGSVNEPEKKFVMQIDGSTFELTDR